MRRLVFLFTVLNLTACTSFFDADASCEEDIFATMRVNAPESAEFMEERCSSFINPTYRATFTLDPADLQTLQDSTPITQWETGADAVANFRDEAANMDTLIVGNHGDGAYFTEVLVDTTDPNRYTVYYYRSFID